MPATINATTANGIVLTPDNSGELGLQTSNTTAVTITAAQNVGIGTNSPARRLHVRGGAGLSLFESTGSACYVYVGDSTSSSIDNQGIGSVGNNLVALTGGTERMRIDSTGKVFFLALAASAGTNALRWSTSTGQMTYDTSSARYKDNIRDSVYGLSHVMQMRSAQFEYKDDGRSDVGFIAEEMQSVVPELVGLDKDGQADSVSYDRIVSVLVKAMQELNAKVDAQAAEIQALKGAA
jgi:hypothetical protein